MKTQQREAQAGGGLALLVEAERRLDARLNATRRQAADELRAAERELTEALEQLHEEMAGELVNLEARMERDHRNRLSSLSQQTASEVARFDIDETTIRRLAEAVAQRILEGDSSAR